MDDNWVRVLVTVLGMVISNLATIKVLRANINNHEEKLKEFKLDTKKNIEQLFSKVNVTMTRSEIEHLVRLCTGNTDKLLVKLSSDLSEVRDEVIKLSVTKAINTSGYERRKSD